MPRHPERMTRSPPVMHSLGTFHSQPENTELMATVSPGIRASFSGIRRHRVPGMPDRRDYTASVDSQVRAPTLEPGL